MRFITSWSGGKDSTASIILEHIHGLPPSDIIFSEVMFDKKRGTSGELPEHIDFVKNKAIPIFESWGYRVEILHADKDYLDCFFSIFRRSKIQERNGKFYGFPLGGMCYINNSCKVLPIHKHLNQFPKTEIVHYVGIASDEDKRLENLDNRRQISLLAKYEYTEKMCFDLCKQFGLLSPIYENCKRGGCWFCPNATTKEMAYTKVHYPELWKELANLAQTPNMVSQGFKYGKSFGEVDREIDMIIDDWETEKNQLRFF